METKKAYIRKVPYNYIENLTKARKARFQKPRKKKVAVTLSMDEDQVIKLRSLYPDKTLSSNVRKLIEEHFTHAFAKNPSESIS